MAELLADQVLRKIGEARKLYHRLILMVGPAGSGKTKALQEVSATTSVPLINVNLELSRRMLELTERQRALQVPRLLEDVCTSSIHRPSSDVFLLDNIEILFDIRLKQDPLRLLQGLSRNRTIVAAWPGRIVDPVPAREDLSKKDARHTTHDLERYLTYAVPDHPEYRHYPIRDFLVASPDLSTGRQG